MRGLGSRRTILAKKTQHLLERKTEKAGYAYSSCFLFGKPCEQRFFQLKGVRQKWNLLSFRESKCVKLLVLRKLAKAPCAALEHFEPRKQIAKAGRCYDYCCRNHTKPKSKLIHAKARESSAKAPRKHLQPPSNPCPFQGPGTF